MKQDGKNETPEDRLTNGEIGRLGYIWEKIRQGRIPFVFILLLIGITQATWYNTSYNYRTQVDITNWTCSASYCQFPIPIALNMTLTNGTDILVVNSSDNALLGFWREDSWNYTNASGNLWVNASNQTTMVYVYYNATGAPDNSSIIGTFPFADDFSGTSLNTTKWQTGDAAKYAVGGGVLNMSAATVANALFAQYRANNTYTYLRYQQSAGESYFSWNQTTGTLANMRCHMVSPTINVMINLSVTGTNTTGATNTWFKCAYNIPIAGNANVTHYNDTGLISSPSVSIAGLPEARDKNLSMLQFTSGVGKVDFVVITPSRLANPNFTVGAQQPNFASIMQISPTNGQILSSNNVSHVFSVSQDMPGNITTKLYIDGVLNQTRTPPSPILYYSFNLNSSANTVDDSGNDNNGTVNNATWTSSGKIGGAYSFDGSNITDASITASDIAATENTTALSICAWVNSAGYGMNGQQIVSKHYQIANGSFYLARLNDGATRFVVINNDSIRVDCNTSTSSYTLNQWQHVCSTYDGSKMNIYLDGILNKNCSQNGTIKNTAYPVMVGSYNLSNGRWNFNGTIDEVYVFNSSLNSTQVAELYSQYNLTVWMPEGNHSWYAVAANSSNSSQNVSSATWNYTVAAFNTTQSFSYTENESDITAYDHIAYVTTRYTAALIAANASMLLNGTVYAPTRTNNGTQMTFTVNTVPPSVTATTNFTVNWSFNLSYVPLGTTDTASGYYNITVIPSNISTNCTAPYVPFLNFTFYSQDALTTPTNSNMSATFSINSAVGGVSKNFSVSIGNVTNMTLCTNLANGTYYVYSTQTFTATAGGYQQLFYFLNNATIAVPNVTQLYLYNLLASGSTATRYIVQSGAGQPINNALVQIYRYYPSTNQLILVSMARTDSNGYADSYAVPNTILYQIVVVEGTMVTFTGAVSALSCDPAATLCQKTILVGEGVSSPFTYYLYGVGYGCTFDNPTMLVYCTSSNPSGTGTNIRLRVWQMGTLQNQLICDNSITAGSGTVYCSIPDINQTYYYMGTTNIGSEAVLGYDFIGGSTRQTMANAGLMSGGMIATGGLLGLPAGPGGVVVGGAFGAVLAGMAGMMDYGIMTLAVIILMALVVALVIARYR